MLEQYLKKLKKYLDIYPNGMRNFDYRQQINSTFLKVYITIERKAYGSTINLKNISMSFNVRNRGVFNGIINWILDYIRGHGDKFQILMVSQVQNFALQKKLFNNPDWVKISDTNDFTFATTPFEEVMRNIPKESQEKLYNIREYIEDTGAIEDFNKMNERDKYLYSLETEENSSSDND
jgi:hypothetical protein